MTRPATAAPELTCPSTSVGNATVFLGMVTPRGEVAYLSPAVPVRPETLDALDRGDQPLEASYRFAGPCVTSRCGFWTGDRCGLGARLAETYAEVADPEDSPLPRCAVRATCRWFAEQGRSACAACRHVVTDTRAVPAG